MLESSWTFRTALIAVLLRTAVPAIAQDLPAIVPMPVSMMATGPECRLDRPWAVHAADSTFRALFEHELRTLSGNNTTAAAAPLPIRFQRIQADTLWPEGYHHITVQADAIIVDAPTDEGLFLGSRTVLQLLEQGVGGHKLPGLSIVDHPRFGWRGMHLDVCRHVFPLDFVKRYIDLLARYKYNTFHWHLTDDQGWRIEIKKYPKLTAVGGWRRGSQIGPYGRREYDTLQYGGSYTQEQVRDVVAYAAARHITVVPEIEMPGHAMAALAAYPALGCTGGPYEVQRGWGVFDDVFCTQDSTIAFLQNVLDEVLQLFPSAYIHVGGDECPHERWAACPKCQAVMQREGLKSTAELQSYVIRRMDQYLTARGRKLIGWDEILDGGLAPNAAVMSWRGTEGGIAAAKAGHAVVMTPGEYCYFDHYQGDPANEPLAIGGYTPLQKVYAFDPLAGLPDSAARYVLGAQANLWSEYITSTAHAEYMVLPRMLALAEVLWTPRRTLNEADFLRRVEAQLAQLDRLGMNASRSLYEVQVALGPAPVTGQVGVTLSSKLPGTIVRSAPGDTTLVPYAGPFTVDRSGPLRIGMLDEHGTMRRMIERTFVLNKATGQVITLSTPPDERYDDGGAFTLVDGISGGVRRVSTQWLAWRTSVTVTVDLGRSQDIAHVGIGSWHETYAWIHQPKNVVVSISADGKRFKPLTTIAAPPNANGRTVYEADVAGSARYVRFTVQHAGNIPAGLAGAGKPAWLFLDEIDVR